MAFHRDGRSWPRYDDIMPRFTTIGKLNAARASNAADFGSASRKMAVARQKHVMKARELPPLLPSSSFAYGITPVDIYDISGTSFSIAQFHSHRRDIYVSHTSVLTGSRKFPLPIPYQFSGEKISTVCLMHEH